MKNSNEPIGKRCDVRQKGEYSGLQYLKRILLLSLKITACQRYGGASFKTLKFRHSGKLKQTRSSWFNCALRDDEAVYWVSIGQFEAVAVGD